MRSADEVNVTDRLELADGDSVLPRIDLPLQATYFPLGFPMEVSTNSEIVIAAADASWKHFPQRFNHTALELRIEVHDDGNNAALPSQPVFKRQWDTLLCIADEHNFVACDLSNGRSFGLVTPSTAKSHLYFRYHLLESAAMSMIAALRAVPVHGACVSAFGSGILLCGDSGAGKSSLAYGAARAGWTYVTDDASYLVLDVHDRQIVGNNHTIRFRSSGAELFPEIGGRPITPRAAGKPSIEIPTTEFSGLVAADSAVVEYIVFLNRKHSGPDTLLRLSKSSVLPWFTQFIVAPAHSRASQEAILERLLSAPIFELRYRDLDWGVARLEQLAASGG